MTETGRSTAAALLLLFALILALLTALIVPAFLSWTENGRSIRADRERVATVEASRTAFARVKYAKDAWDLFVASPDAGFLDAPTPEAALALARTHVEAMLARHGGTLDAAEFTAGETKREQVETIMIDLTTTLPKSTLAPFLADLENKPPYTFISNFRMTERDEGTVRLVLKGQMQRLLEKPS